MEVLAHIRRDPTRSNRWVLFLADGTASNKFDLDETRDDVVRVCAANGFTVRDDDSVVRA